MQKTATLNIRISHEAKRSAETILSQLGVPMSTAIDMFLKQIALTGGIPFPVALPKAPDSVNADIMSISQVREALREGLDDMEAGRVVSAREAFARFEDGRTNEAL